VPTSPGAPAFEQLAAWPGGHAAAGVTNTANTIADAGQLDYQHPWASVTKMLTAYRILQLAEAGTLSLDDPAGPPGSTVRHLLAHASGLDIDGDGVLAAIGRRRIYSNAGFELLGALAEQRVGQPFADQVHDNIVRPLAMTATAIEGSAASGAAGPLRDLLRFGRELLAPTLVAPETLAEATAVVFPGLNGVLPGFGGQRPNDWGLGFEIRDSKHPHWTGHTNSPATFGHFGRAGSFLWVDPTIGLACAALTGVDFGPWAIEAWPSLSDAVIDQYS
jgi:CubicO group peptidase (beta-lactamase class C family)